MITGKQRTKGSFNLFHVKNATALQGKDYTFLDNKPTYIEQVVPNNTFPNIKRYIRTHNRCKVVINKRGR